jgi:hypothetical protein
MVAKKRRALAETVQDTGHRTQHNTRGGTVQYNTEQNRREQRHVRVYSDY